MDRIEQLERLQSLRDDGVLSENEFAAEKARILAGEPDLAGDDMAVGVELVEAEPKRRIIWPVVLAVVVLLPVAIALGVWLASSLGVGSGASAPDTVASATPSPEAKPEEPIVAAFRAATGKTGPFKRDSDGGPVLEGPERLLQLPFATVLITSAGPPDGDVTCHGCYGSLGIYYLLERGDGFVATGRWPDAVPGWGWGQPPEWELTDRFTSSPAIFSDGGYANNGVSCSGANITELTPDGPVESDLIGLSTSNRGMVGDEDEPIVPGMELYELEGRIVNIVKDRSFDVEATGSETLTEHYVRRGKGFRRTTPSTSLSC
ncbi:MAG: SHOCT domain-containing protein [Novosphingobium sp.]|nr:SHOCT domain-containing protein [Novosphingobium sp.]